MKKYKNIIIAVLTTFILLSLLTVYYRDELGAWLLSDKAEAIEKQRLKQEMKMITIMKENVELKSKIKFLETQKNKKSGYIDENRRVYDGLKDANELNNKIAKEIGLDLQERADAYNKICKTKLKKEDVEMRIQLYISYMQPREEQLKQIYSLKSNELSKISEILHDKNFVKHLCENKFKAEKTIPVQ